MRSIGVFRALWVIFFVVCFQACLGRESNSSDEDNTPTSVTETVDSSGGKVFHPRGATLDIPEGALREQTEITIEKVESDADEVEDLEKLGPVFRFLPEGLLFEAKVKVKLVYDSESRNQGDAIAYWTGVGDETTWEAIGGKTAGKNLWQAEITHFSMGFIGVKKCIPNPCQNGGTCQRNDETAECTCTGNWSGSFCDTCGLPCGDYGSCDESCESCICNNGYGGESCDIPPDATFLDTTTGYLWQTLPNETGLSWTNAMDYCENLSLGGYEDWRLPSLSELRSIVSGCKDMEPDSSCGAGDECTTLDCSTGCNSCEKNSGPSDGCYWVLGLHGYCDNYHWTATPFGGIENYVWQIGFSHAAINGYVNSSKNYARCVRNAEDI